MTETELIAGLMKQSPQAQQQMLDQYGRDVFAQVVRLVSVVENAEEVYQDVFVKVFQHIDRYDAEKVVYFEDQGNKIEALTDAEVDETFGQANQETVQLIRAALKYLPPDERAIITMFYYEERSLKEIAYITESIPTTIASKLSRTRKKLCRIINMLRS